jgi:dTDP-4-dehydrorhamnose reductase
VPRRPRVLVTGAAGLLGGRLAELLASAHDVIAMRHRAPVPAGLTAVDADLLDLSALERAIETARPDAVLHSAALADADRCEAEPDLARRCNVEASAEIARLCRARGLRLVALSTDLVLGGDVAFSVEDPPARPVLVYGRTKLDAEEAILGESPGAVVLRVALVIGRGYGPRTTASESVAAALVAGRRPRLFDDQYRTPIDPESIADAVARVLQGTMAGRYHLGGAERLSRYELGQRVAQVLGLRGSFERVSQTSQSVLRPADASLDSSRARRELGWTPRPLDEAIRDGRRPAV